MAFEIVLVLLFLLCCAASVLLGSCRASIYRFFVGTEKDVIPFLRKVEFEQLKDLLNIADEGFLRLNLSPEKFRKEQQRRMRLTLEQLGRGRHNARPCQEWGGNTLRKSWKTGNREVTAASEELINICIAFRAYAWIATIKLHIWLFVIVALPFLPVPILGSIRRIGHIDLVCTYDQIRQAAAKLGRLSGSKYGEEIAQFL
jgi:hypothetical protein